MTQGTSTEAVNNLVVRLMEAETPYVPMLHPHGGRQPALDDRLHPDAWRMIEALAAERDELRSATRFLIDRLGEWSPDNLTDETASDWIGHVEPAIERADAALNGGDNAA